MLDKHINSNVIKLNNKFNLFFSFSRSLLYLFGIYGVVALKLPSYYFFMNTKQQLSLSFVNYFYYISFLKHFTNNYKKIFNIYIVNIKVKGLGYRIRRVVDNIYYFFFNYTNMFYFYIPNNILIKWYKKRIVLVSFDFVLLKSIFSNILLLKNIGSYRLRGVRYPRQIILLKKGNKKV
jgi:hypothetical protein